MMQLCLFFLAIVRLFHNPECFLAILNLYDCNSDFFPCNSEFISRNSDFFPCNSEFISRNSEFFLSILSLYHAILTFFLQLRDYMCNSDFFPRNCEFVS